jgi:hypothetical protein
MSYSSQRDDERQARGAAQEGDLQRRVGACELLEARIQQRKEEYGAKHRDNAAEVGRLHVVSVRCRNGQRQRLPGFGNAR